MSSDKNPKNPAGNSSKSQPSRPIKEEKSYTMPRPQAQTPPPKK